MKWFVILNRDGVPQTYFQEEGWPEDYFDYWCDQHFPFYGSFEEVDYPPAEWLEKKVMKLKREIEEASLLIEEYQGLINVETKAESV